MKCKECKWWKEQGPRTKDIDFQPTIIGWCKRMPRTEYDKDQGDWCGEFEKAETGSGKPRVFNKE